MVIGLERTVTLIAAGQELDGIFFPAFPAFQTLEEAHFYTFLYSLSSLDKGKMKKPRAKLARGFFQPLRSCLAVFYVEQVALNRHVYVQKYKEQSKTETKRYRGARREVKKNLHLTCQLVSRGISRFENVGSGVLEAS